MKQFLLLFILLCPYIIISSDNQKNYTKNDMFTGYIYYVLQSSNELDETNLHTIINDIHAFFDPSDIKNLYEAASPYGKKLLENQGFVKTTPHKSNDLRPPSYSNVKIAKEDIF